MTTVVPGQFGPIRTIENRNRRTMVASSIGTVLAWYDFGLYGLASALVFGPLFFNGNGVGGTMAAFGTFAVGFLARPIGGIVFGHFGDRIGRSRTLLVTLVMMGTSTTLIGLLPTIGAAGSLAPVLLVTLRVCQGIAVGGEFAGATLLTVENAPTGKRGFHGAIPATGTAGGFVLASVAFGLATGLPDPDFLSWGWRVPFLASAVLAGFGVWARRRIGETEEFARVRDANEIVAFPLGVVVREHPGATLRVMGITISGFVWGYLLQAFALSYGVTTLGLSKSTMLWSIVFASALELVAIPFWGWLSDRIGRRLMVSIGLIFTMAYIYPFFALLETRSTPLIVLAMVLAIPVAKDMVFGPQAALVAEQFDARVRYSGVSVGREFGGALFGGTAPLVGTALLSYTKAISSVALYVILGCMVTMLAAVACTETAKAGLGEFDDLD